MFDNIDWVQFLTDPVTLASALACVATVLCDRGDRYFVPLKWERTDAC